jgi:colanic acid/amylovoran biosynthesis glycosyltransferase
VFFLSRALKKLVLFTASYPFSVAAEDTFLDPELKRARKFFEKIIIIPSRNEGNRNVTIGDIVVEEDFATRFAQFRSNKFCMLKFVLKGVSRREFFEELSINFKRLVHPLAFLKMVYVLSIACLVEEWVSSYIETNRLDPEQTIFYTFWCNEITLGLCFVKKKKPLMDIVSRANGYDIYEEQNIPPFIPFRYTTFHNIRGLYLVSNSARDYLAGLYPPFVEKLFFSHMGVDDPGFTTSSSTDGALRIVSCAYIVPVKRIQLMMDGIIALAKRMRTAKIYWTHIGEGEQKNDLAKYAQLHSPENLSVHFSGYIPSVYEYYKNHEVDLFINTSSSEGIPISIMEAQSCGIPVAATAVGGIPEIVSDDSGVLLPPDPSPDDIADAILTFMQKTSTGRQFRFLARNNWKTNYNAEINYNLFYESILNISLPKKEVQEI